MRNLARLAISSFEDSKETQLREFYYLYMDLSIEESEYTLKIIVMVLLATVNSFKGFRNELMDRLDND